MPESSHANYKTTKLSNFSFISVIITYTQLHLYDQEDLLRAKLWRSYYFQYDLVQKSCDARRLFFFNPKNNLSEIHISQPTP